MPNDPTPPARIQPRTLKGFRDYLPETMIPRQRCMDTARDVFQRFGFAPIDTPALEYLEVLTGKGSEETDRQMFYFTDNGGRNVGMRFDLTVPLARFAAQHAATLGTPFRRFHIAPVWRGETPQKGRFREFIQCDFDTIGTRSVAADTEIVLVIHQLLTALDVPGFKIHLNNRQVLTGLLQHLGLENLSTAILRSLDKLGKIGREKTAAEMVSAAGISASDADAVLRLADLQGDTMQVLDDLPSVTGGNETAAEGTNRLRAIVDNAIASGVSADQVQLDVSIARGLDYYTGVIFETFLDDLPQI
ncbi:MAG: HisS family protein, partial [Planctomycetota bacterium]